MGPSAGPADILRGLGTPVLIWQKPKSPLRQGAGAEVRGTRIAVFRDSGSEQYCTLPIIQDFQDFVWQRT